MKADATDECFNVGMGVKTTINELVDAAARAHRLDARARVPARRSRCFVTHRVGSTEKAAERPRLPARGPARRRAAVGRRLAPTQRPACSAVEPSSRRRVVTSASRSPSRSSATRSCAAVAAPLESGWVVQGPCVAEFEERFAAFTGAPHAVATTLVHDGAAPRASPRSALKPGDEVIVPAFTWVSTANVVEYMGATPVFCDVDLDTFNIDVAADRGARHAAHGRHHPGASVRAVRRHGRRSWRSRGRARPVGRRGRGVRVRRAGTDGRHAGTFGDAGCFSFHPRKSITTGEGGMVTTASDRARRRSLRIAARSRRVALGPRAPRRRTAASCSPTIDVPRLQLPDDRHPGRARLRADGPRRPTSSASARAARRALRRAAGRRRAGCGRPSTPDGDVHGYQAYVTVCSRPRSRRSATSTRCTSAATR